MNFIRFNYLYRDYSNYKKHGSVIFSNPNNLPLEEIDAIIRRHLLDETWFIHSQWGIPDLHFEKTDWENDHPYHEYGGVEIITISNSIEIYSIELFLLRLKVVFS